MSLVELCDKHITQTKQAKQAIMDEKREILRKQGKLCMYIIIIIIPNINALFP